MYYLEQTPEFGRGLYALHNIKVGTIIMECELLVLSGPDTLVANNTDLQYYTFKYNDTQDCLVLGMGEIFNHSDTANVGYKLINLGERKVMQFYALEDIQSGNQLFIDYAFDTKIDVSKYTVNLI